MAPAFPVELLPPDTGLILADRYGGEIVRPAPQTRLAPARRKAMTLRLEPLRRRSLLPALSVGDLIALLALAVVSAALLLEGYNKNFTDYSREIVALFAVVVGFLLGRKT